MGFYILNCLCILATIFLNRTLRVRAIKLFFLWKRIKKAKWQPCPWPPSDTKIILSKSWQIFWVKLFIFSNSHLFGSESKKFNQRIIHTLQKRNNFWYKFVCKQILSKGKGIQKYYNMYDVIYKLTLKISASFPCYILKIGTLTILILYHKKLCSRKVKLKLPTV